MIKIISLRDHLLSIPDEIKIEPENLITYGSEGRLVSAPYGTNQHFEISYQANIIINNYSGESLQLLFWLLSWFHQKQPDHEADAARWDVDILNDKEVDISFALPLTETVKVDNTAEGIVLTSVDDPNMAPVLLAAENWSMFLNDEATPAETWVQGG